MKKAFKIFLVCALLLSAAVIPAGAEVAVTEAYDIVYGDVNGDGFVDSLDAAWILKQDVMRNAELTEAQAEAGDVNMDGFVDSLDAAWVLKLDAGIDPTGGKLEGKLPAVMSTKGNDELIHIWVWLVDTVHEEDIMEIMRTEKGMDPSVYENQKSFEALVREKIANGEIVLSDPDDPLVFQAALREEIDKYNTAWRETVKEKHTAFNSAFLEKYVDPDRTVHYFSTYTSTLIIDATKAEILKYIRLDEVVSLSFDEDYELVST
ncbi:MAG: dockerin type I repeat-containing protein [Clostridia bacterium]|nr:dockerin type I repeat-containing protein [Clostridia bacterium]